MVVVHLKLIHNGFPMDGALVGARSHNPNGPMCGTILLWKVEISAKPFIGSTESWQTSVTICCC